jgi:hypothetical protein
MHVDQAERLTNEGGADSDRSRETEVEEPAHGLRVGEDEDDDANLVALADSVEAARDASHQADGAGAIADEHVSSDEDDDGSWICRPCNTRKPSLAANKNRLVCKKCDMKVNFRYEKGLGELECRGLDGQCILPEDCPGCLVARFVWWGHYPNSEKYHGQKILEFETWLSNYPHPDPFENTDRQERIRGLRPA